MYYESINYFYYKNKIGRFFGRKRKLVWQDVVVFWEGCGRLGVPDLATLLLISMRRDTAAQSILDSCNSASSHMHNCKYYQNE